MSKTTKTAARPLGQAITRRIALATVGGLAASLLARRGQREARAAGAGARPVCPLTPEQEEGPFYVPVHLLRRDITEGQRGVPLAITFRVLDAGACRAVPGAVVDVWHCNAAGDYSDEEMQRTTGATFLRGMQTTDAKGEATFQSVFPGWYRGRTVHVHVKVRTASGRTCHTGDVFFPQAVNDALALVEPYARVSLGPRTRNEDDHVLVSQGGSQCLCSVTGTVTVGLTAAIALAVDPLAEPAPVRGWPGRSG